MTITTTPAIEGKQIAEYLGIVSGCVMFAVPGGTKMIQRGWSAGMEAVTAEIAKQAAELGADAIVGMKADAYRSGMCDYLHATGTAVKLA